MPDSESDDGSATPLEQSDLSSSPLPVSGLWRYNTHFWHAPYKDKSPYEDKGQPIALNSLVTYLLRFSENFQARWPLSCNTPEELLAVIEAEPSEDIAELKAALHRATLLTNEIIKKCESLGPRSHLRVVTTPTLNAVFQSAWEADEVTWASASRWTSGKELCYLRKGKKLPIPVPDEAIGLAPTRDLPPGSLAHDSDVLSKRVLEWLSYSCHPGIIYDPCGVRETCYPAFIYHAGSQHDEDDNPEGHASIAAMEALALLEHLRKISELPSREPIGILATSVGQCWDFHIATSRQCSWSAMNAVSRLTTADVCQCMSPGLTQQSILPCGCRTSIASLRLFSLMICRIECGSN